MARIPPVASKRVYSPSEACELIGISRRTLDVLRGRQEIAFVRLSTRRIGFLAEDLDRFLASRRVVSQATTRL